MEVSARISKERAIKEQKLEADEVGVFFISPCAAKATSVKAPYERKSSFVDGVISINDIYLSLLAELTNAKEEENFQLAGYRGISWAGSEGERLALENSEYLAVDGIHNVMKILEEIENDRIKGVEFVEALACVGGCLGGPLTVQNAFVAKTRLKKHAEEARVQNMLIDSCSNYEDMAWTGNIQHNPAMELDKDINNAIKKLDALESINENLPGLDCGACGAPNCRALAEDIVRGIANETDCIFKLKEKVKELSIELLELESKGSSDQKECKK
jgi:hypothetical protein